MRPRRAPGLRSRAGHHGRTPERHVSTALHIALTAAGMRALGVAEDVIARLFRRNSSPAWRARRGARGGSATSAPARRRIGAGAAHESRTSCSCCMPGPICTRGARRWKRRDSDAALPCSTTLPTTRHGRQGAVRLYRRRQPAALDWSGERQPGTTADLDYGNLIARRRVPAGLSERVRPVSPIGRCSIREQDAARMLAGCRG